MDGNNPESAIRNWQPLSPILFEVSDLQCQR